jgi:tetratricopeptide (TPR) repeat protein
MHFDGRFEESIAMIKKSMRLCPNYPATYLQFLARYHIMAGRYEEAIAAGKLLLSRSDRTEYDVMSANRSLAQAYIQVGENEQAKRYLEDARKINPKHFYTLVWNREREMRSYRDTADAERFLAMLEKVGLK